MVYIVLEKKAIRPVAVIDDTNNKIHCEKGYEVLMAELSEVLKKRFGEQDFLEEWQQEWRQRNS